MLFCWWREKGGHKEAKDFLKWPLILFDPATNMRKITKSYKLFKSRHDKIGQVQFQGDSKQLQKVFGSVVEPEDFTIQGIP
jgi:hypothetical protein